MKTKHLLHQAAVAFASNVLPGSPKNIMWKINRPHSPRKFGGNTAYQIYIANPDAYN